MEHGVINRCMDCLHVDQDNNKIYIPHFSNRDYSEGSENDDSILKTDFGTTATVSTLFKNLVVLIQYNNSF